MIKISSKNKKAVKFNPTIQLLLAVSLFVVATLLSRGNQISQLETAIFKSIYGLGSFFYPFFIFITQFGSVFILGVLLIVFLLMRHYHVVLRLLLSGTLAYTLSGVAKDLWGRLRPHEIFAEVSSLDAVIRGPGYPSGHAALAAALALTLGYYWHGRRKWLVATIIVGVAMSRIYLGAHLPLDVVGGFAIGWGAYALFRHVRLQDLAPKTRPNRRTS